ncbi:UNVERIFIED_ORG: hypothetical protein QOE_2315 [Clostridioides difficile F501]
MKYAFITSISLRGNSHAKIQLLAASCLISATLLYKNNLKH